MKKKALREMKCEIQRERECEEVGSEEKHREREKKMREEKVNPSASQHDYFLGFLEQL